jgi:hypothetical protein
MVVVEVEEEVVEVEVVEMESAVEVVEGEGAMQVEVVEAEKAAEEEGAMRAVELVEAEKAVEEEGAMRAVEVMGEAGTVTSFRRTCKNGSTFTEYGLVQKLRRKRKQKRNLIFSTLYRKQRHPPPI